MSKTCLKCGFINEKPGDQCPGCGRFYAKMEAVWAKTNPEKIEPVIEDVSDENQELVKEKQPIGFGKLLGYGLCVLFILIPVLGSLPPAKQNPSVQQAVIKKSLSITPETFRNEFNQAVASINPRYVLPILTIQHGDSFDVFNQMLSNGLGVISTINKDDGTMRDFVVMLGSGNKDSLEAVVVILASAQIFNSRIAKEQNNKVIMEMIDTLNKTKSKQEERVVGDLKYTAMANSGLGLWFSFGHN